MRFSTTLALGFLLAIGIPEGISAHQMGDMGEHAMPPSPEPTKGGQPMEPAQPMGEMGMEMGQKGMGTCGMCMTPMDEQMTALQDHSKMMEGITDQKKLAAEMKKHMRMMDGMMETMMKSHASSPAPAPPAPHPSGGHM